MSTSSVSNQADQVKTPTKQSQVSDQAVAQSQQKSDQTAQPRYWFTPKVRRIAIYLLSVLFLVGSVVTVMQMPAKATQIQTLRSQALSSQISQQDIRLLEQSLKETQDKRQIIRAAFPDESSLLDFIDIIDSIRDSEVTVIKFSVDSDIPTKIGKNPSFLPMSLVLRGSDVQVKQALERLVAAPYFLKTLTFSKEYISDLDVVVVSTQFQIFVSEKFSASS